MPHANALLIRAFCELVGKILTFYIEQKDEIWVSYEKKPYTYRNVKKAKWQHKTSPKRAIADRL